MPIRNGASSLALAMADLRAAMGPDDELLAVDDGSTDGTPHLLAEWSGRDPRIRVITTAGLGLVAALNLGVAEASNEWLARADADDRYPQDRLNLQRSALADNVALVTGDYLLSSPRGPSTYLPCALGHPFVALSLINPQRIPHPGVLICRGAVVAAGGYRDEDFPAEDVGLWIRVASQGRFVGVLGCVVDWSMNPGSITHSRQIEQRRRTTELLSKWQPDFLDLVDEAAVQQELSRYASVSYGAERTLLLLRDLRSWRRREAKVGGQSRVVKELMRHPATALAAGWRLSREAHIRRRERAAVSSEPLEP